MNSVTLRVSIASDRELALYYAITFFFGYSTVCQFRFFFSFRYQTKILSNLFNMRITLSNKALLAISLIFLVSHCHVAESQKQTDEVVNGDEPTTKKPGFFGRLFGRSKTTTPVPQVVENAPKGVPVAVTTTTTTTTISPLHVPSLAPMLPVPPSPVEPKPQPQFHPTQKPISSPTPSRPAFGASVPNSGPNMPPGFSPYRPQKPQPSGFDLSYGGGGGAGPTVPPRSGARPQNGAGGHLSPLTPSTTSTTTTTTIRPKASLAKPEDDFGISMPTLATTKKPAQQSKEDFPALPPPRRPSMKEDFPPLPTPKTPPGSAVPAPAFPAGSITPPRTTTRTPPSSPSTPAGGVAFVPHVPASTTTTRPGVSTTVKSFATDDEIRAVTENLYTKEVNHQINLIQFNPQGKTRSIDSTDEAPQPLLQVDEKALETPTIAKLRLLFNNYEMDTLTNEYVTPNERREENDFVDAVMATSVMRQAMLFLQNRGLVSPDPKTHRDLVKELWFTQYSRGSGKIGSSGFEHVFVNEVKNGTIIGLHNWVYFYEEEKAGKLDYKGYLNKVDLGDKGKVAKVRFTHNGNNKPVNTLFVGTSPELELALYTLCFQLRPDRTCPVSLGGTKFGIVTYSWRYRGKNLIGSAYPEI